LPEIDVPGEQHFFSDEERKKLRKCLYFWTCGGVYVENRQVGRGKINLGATPDFGVSQKGPGWL
jgi:hypothetical protein